MTKRILCHSERSEESPPFEPLITLIFVMGYDFLLVPLPLDAQGGIEGGLESRVFLNCDCGDVE